VTPSCLGGKPPRVTNASKACRRESEVLKLWDDHVSSQKIIQDHSLNPTQKYGLNHTNLTMRGLGRVSWLWLSKNIWGSTPTTLEPATPTFGAHGVFILLFKKN
jgi:hypothetical protein